MNKGTNSYTKGFKSRVLLDFFPYSQLNNSLTSLKFSGFFGIILKTLFNLSVLKRTRFDHGVDKNSKNPGKQVSKSIIWKLLFPSVPSIIVSFVQVFREAKFVVYKIFLPLFLWLCGLYARNIYVNDHFPYSLPHIIIITRAAWSRISSSLLLNY